MESKGKDSRIGGRLALRAIKLLNVILVSIPFAIMWYAVFSQALSKPFYRKGNWVLVFLFLFLYYELAHLYSGFLIHLRRITEIIYSQATAVIVADIIIYFVMLLLIRHFPNFLFMLLMFGIQIVIVIIWSILAHQWFFRKNKPSPTVIIYDEMDGLEALVKQYGLQKRFRIINTVHISELQHKNADNLSQEERDAYAMDLVKKELQYAKVVFLCCLHSHTRNQIIKYCVEAKLVVWCIPRLGDVIMSSSTRMNLFHLPMLMLTRYNPNPEYLAIKRAFDIVVSGITLVIASPLMAVLAFLIRRDGGTAFYRQKRLTKDGKIFEILKFRSMRMDAEKDGVARLSTGENDDRITKIGHFIRACRMDELPQLINILKGDMSIVGPRPERPEIAEQYRKILPEFDLRL